MTTPFRYWSFGFHYSSEIELSGIPEVDSAAAPDVQIRWGAVPAALPRPVDRGSSYGIEYEAEPGRLLLSIAAVGRYLVSDGNSIVVEGCANAAADEIRACLMGSAFGALLHQRGLMPLHASAVRVAEGCVGFAGAAGAGKSTMATLCREAGYEVVCDDLMPLTITPDGPAVWPGFPRIKVWSDSLAALGVRYESYPRVVHKCDKYELPTTSQASELIPLRRLYVLDAAPAGSGTPLAAVPLDEGSRLEAIVNNTYRYEFLKGLGLREQHFHICTTLLRSLAVHRLTRVWDLDRLQEVRQGLANEFQQLR